MDSIQIKTLSKKDLKPKTHHFFFVIVFLAGFIAPPVAMVIRFGVGRDFFLNILLTLCGYFPGQIHNFYCQTIRNNSNAARTPKWAVKYGLVHVSDKRAGKHQWAGRYDERLPDSAQADYNTPEGTTAAQAGGWDGRGPEPAKQNRVGNNIGNSNHRSGFSPWSNEVDVTEVEGGPRTLEEYDEEERIARGGKKVVGGRKADPLENEEFYASTSQTASQGGDVSSSGGKAGKKGKGKGIKGFLSHRDRYENQDGPESSTASSAQGDRFDRMNASRSDNDGSLGGGGGDEYADEFERELNTGSKVSKGNHNNAEGRFDEFDNDPLAVSSGPVKTTNANSDPFNHTF